MVSWLPPQQFSWYSSRLAKRPTHLHLSVIDINSSCLISYRPCFSVQSRSFGIILVFAVQVSDPYRAHTGYKPYRSAPPSSYSINNFHRLPIVTILPKYSLTMNYHILGKCNHIIKHVLFFIFILRSVFTLCLLTRWSSNVVGYKKIRIIYTILRNHTFVNSTFTY